MHIADNNQLIPVSGNVRAGLVTFDPFNPDHLKLFRSRGVGLYKRLARKHGAEFYPENIENIIKAAERSELKLRFVVVANKLCRPVVAGVMTGVQTYDVRWDKNGNRYVVPFEHGEDLVLNERIARWFREATKTEANPKGEGLGSIAVREQINQAANDPIFRSGGKDNEHSLTNEAIKGVMVKNGAIIGTEKDSLVFQVKRSAIDLNDSFGLDIEIEFPHVQGNFFARDENSVITHWVSYDRKQQCSMVFTKIPATSDPDPVVWTRVTSNDNPPDKEALPKVLRSLLKAGINAIEAPNRVWTIPLGMESSVDFYRTFGGLSPEDFHIHIYKNNHVIEAMEKIGMPRYYGKEQMVSGQIDYAAAAASSGQETYKPTIVQSTSEEIVNRPMEEFVRPITGNMLSQPDIRL